jgi:hypothetical protein
MRSISISILVGFLVISNHVFSQELVQAFQTHNQSPLIHSLGLPTNPGARILEKNSFRFGNYFNMANNATSATTEDETIYLDGEMYRNEIYLSYGLFAKLEVGLMIPILKHSTGIMDSFISGWHDAFNLPGRARSAMPKYDLDYYLVQDEELAFQMNQSKWGVGDISFSLGYPILQAPNHDLAFRSYLKIPVGNKSDLIGSGTFDLSFQLSGMIHSIPRKKQMSFYYSAGYLHIGKGALLSNLISSNVGFGNFGCSYNFNNKWYAKSQLDFHTSFYNKSNTRQLGKSSVQFVLGVDHYIAKSTSLSFCFVEDLIVNTAPDFTFQVGLLQQF